MADSPAEFSASESALLARFFTNMDRPVFALRNLPEVVKGALFSRYSRTEKSLRRVLLDEFINEPDSGFERLAGSEAGADDMVAVRRAEEFYERVLVGYGDDSVAELAGAHVAVERVSTLAAKSPGRQPHRYLSAGEVDPLCALRHAGARRQVPLPSRP